MTPGARGCRCPHCTPKGMRPLPAPSPRPPPVTERLSIRWGRSPSLGGKAEGPHKALLLQDTWPWLQGALLALQ